MNAPARNLIRAGALLLALALPAFCAPRAPKSEVTVRRLSGGLYSVSGTLSVPASTAAAWSVITDYDGIPRFVSSMKASSVVERERDGSLLVEQTAVGQMFLLSKTLRVLLQVRRDAGDLAFDDVRRRDFRVYSGRWIVAPSRGGCTVRYLLLAEPDFPAPGFLMNGAMRRGARNLLDQVGAEILRRARSQAALRSRASGGPSRKF